MKHFTLTKRKKLHDLLRNGETYRNMSKVLGFSISSISEEINRNGGLLKSCPFLAEKRAQDQKGGVKYCER
jgi:IS30 family transposase